MSQTVTVTVGRDVKHIPMCTKDWADFTSAVRSVLAKQGYVYFAGVGDGTSDWGLEDAYTVVAAAEWGAGMLARTHDELAKVGRYYGQEAVAVTIGDTAFV